MPETKSNFFRQSAWMVAATVMGGVGMTLVHSFLGNVHRWPADTYNQFKSLLGLYYMFGAGQAGIWTLFAQRTAMAITPEQLGSVARAARQTAVAAAALMGLAAIYILFWGRHAVAAYKLEGVGALWATWGLMLATFWLAIIRGILQGKQNFFALGWVSILDGLGRVAAVVGVVTFFHGRATGAIGGALLGNLAALALGICAVGPFLKTGGKAPDWRIWLGILIPLTASAAALQWLSQYDQIFLRGVIPEERLEEFNLGMRYSPGQLIGFAIGQFTVPLALVMFPKVARSRAMSERSNVLKLTVLSSLVLGGLAALGCTLLPWLPVRVLYRTYDPSVAAPLVPWFAWAMLAYTLSNVLISNLLAHSRFGVVPFMAAVALGFILILKFMGGRVLGMAPADGLRWVAAIVLMANLAMLALAAWFTRIAAVQPGSAAAGAKPESPT